MGYARKTNRAKSSNIKITNLTAPRSIEPIAVEVKRIESMDKFDVKEKALEMIQDLQDFGGAKDTEAIFNFKHEGRKLQVQIVLIDSDEDDFIDFEGVPEVNIEK